MEQEADIWVQRASVMRLENGVVYLEDHSGERVFRRVMPISILIANHATAAKIIAEWHRQTAEVIELSHAG